MATNHKAIFDALAAPFPPDQIKSRQGGGGRKLSYITARLAMNRLDEVLGPENWQDEYYEVCDVLFCRLTIRLPDGTTLSKSGAGGFKEMTERARDGSTVVDEENTDKTGESDAFKRAAVKFGVARYLYQDGTAKLVSNGSGHGSGMYASPKDVDAYRESMESLLEEVGAKWADHHTDPHTGEIDPKLPQLCNLWQLSNHLCKWGVEQGVIDNPGDGKHDKSLKTAALVWLRATVRCEEEARAYLRKLWKEKADALKAKAVPVDANGQAADEWPDDRE